MVAFAPLAYLVAAICFIMALRGLSSPETSRQGNNYGIVGMVIAIVTTLMLPGLISGLSLTLIIIGIAATIQVLVHLRYFLHLDLTSTPRENLVAIVFTAILIVLMVGGSFWIMFDLHSRMAM